MKLEQIHIRDPYILAHGSKYYLYGTRGKNCWDYCTGFDVYVSQDLEDWSEPVSVFEKTDDFWSDRQFWAPEVHAYQGKFYMFASFKAEGRCRGTQILVSDAPDKPFVPLTKEPVTPEDWECLDGTLYVDKNGTPYMIFCHEWVQVHDGEMCAIELTKDLKHAVGEPKILFRASEPEWADKGKTDYITDGPFLYRTENGQLLMIWSSIADGNYVEAVSYSDHQELDGEWKHSRDLLFDKDGGHGMIFRTFSGELIFVMHAPNVSPNERPVLKKIKEQEGRLMLDI